MKRRVTAAVGAATASALLGLMTNSGSAIPAGISAPSSDENTNPWARALLADTRPVGPPPRVTYEGTTASSANPYLAMVPNPEDIRWRYWQRKLASASALKAEAANDLTVTPIVHDEQEPQGTNGSNDRRRNAETLAGFGLRADKTSAVRVLGTLSPPQPSYRPAKTREDNGSIQKATRTGINKPGEGIKLRSVIGDGPHGSRGDGSGDFDIYKVSARAGQRITASSKGSELSTVLVVYERFGSRWDWTEVGLDSLNYAVPADGDYYVLVAASDSYLVDPTDSGSGTGAGEEGPYRLKLGLSVFDRDFYRVRLRSGDVLGGTVNGRSEDLSVMRPDGTEVFGSTQDASFIYPMESPLPGGERATVSYVVEEAGWYTVSTAHGRGAYDMLLELYRPGAEAEGSTQKIFLDFDGERVNTGMWGGRGVSNLSPLSAFLGRWHLPSSAEDRLIEKVVATVRENLRRDLIARGLNDDVRVIVLNSRDHADPWGQDNVSRVIVGGTIQQSGLFTIGIAESIDPGNFAHEESALVLLDILSGTKDSYFGDASLNYYLKPGSKRVAFVGQALGNVIAHEAGHFVGSWHVDQFDKRANIMDQGGNFAKMFGVGPDGVGGTDDDRDVDFGENELNPYEGFEGIEDTLNNTAWAF
ncbi:MAG: hypothetical protein H0V02_07605 [Nocardioidaceae bacterium]|nr:hypothetical protein [Nocardioidaceae bacterium]